MRSENLAEIHRKAPAFLREFRTLAAQRNTLLPILIPGELSAAWNANKCKKLRREGERDHDSH